MQPTTSTATHSSSTDARLWMSGAFAAEAAFAPLLLRTTLAAVMFPHGAQKLLGWFGGLGLSATLAFFTDAMHLPWPLALLIILLESIGSVALLLGLATRPMAAGLAAIMIGAIATVHAPHGFFMNWFGTQSGEGFEYHLLAIGIAVALVITGGGRASLDARTLPLFARSDRR